MQGARMDDVQQKVSDYVRVVGRVRANDLQKHLYDEGVRPEDAKRVIVEELVAIESTPWTRKTEQYFFKFPNISGSATPWTGYKVLSYDYDILVEERHLPAVTGLLPPVKGSGLLPPPRYNDGIIVKKEGHVIDTVSRTYILLK